jgi:tetratricopeptide (TPR) repeat protein
MSLRTLLARLPKSVTAGIGVAAVTAGLFTVDRLLARVERTEIQSQAEAKYRSGMSLLRHGENGAALVLLQQAHSLDRTRREYTRSFSEGLIATGRRDEAASQLREILREDSNDGRANLLLARLLAADSKITDAITFYRRAIYGSWRSDSAKQAMAVRLELARYLAKNDRPRELLSELLLLQDTPGKDPRLDRELAALFITADSPQRAEQMYRDLLHNRPDDSAAYSGLGEAYLLEGDYRAAESAFLSAFRNQRGNAELIRRLRFANQLALLDPTSRRLSSAEKYKRASHLLDSIRQEISQCDAAVAQAGVPSPPVSAATDPEKQKGPIGNEAAEAQLSLAEQLWDVRSRVCSGKPSLDPATAIIMQKVKRVQ